MTTVLKGRNVNEVYFKGLKHLRDEGVRSNSRNGEVIKSPAPVISEYHRPRERVLWCPVRDANPVFHLVEAMWMLAGKFSVEDLLPFNLRMLEYAEPSGDLHGAYGYRWRNHFDDDQLWTIVHMLKANPETRRAVLTMWDPDEDLGQNRRKDLPCNTQVYFNTSTAGFLDMTVTCRSNDAIWGAYGANVVHMSILHEWVSLATGMDMGVYRQFSNDFHVYPGMPRFEEIFHTEPTTADPYVPHGPLPIIPLFPNGDLEAAQDFLFDCHDLFSKPGREFRTEFFNGVVAPLYRSYIQRKNGREGWMEPAMNMAECDWEVAFKLWCLRRTKPEGELA